MKISREIKVGALATLCLFLLFFGFNFLKGVNIFPIQIETILMKYQELASDYLITLETRDDNDMMTVEVELKDLFIDDYSKLQALEKDITRRLRDEILITPRVRLVPKGSLPVSEGKAVRVKDLRKQY